MGIVNHMAHTVSTQAVSVRDQQVAKPVLSELRLLSWGLFYFPIFLFCLPTAPLYLVVSLSYSLLRSMFSSSCSKLPMSINRL